MIIIEFKKHKYDISDRLCFIRVLIRHGFIFVAPKVIQSARH